MQDRNAVKSEDLVQHYYNTVLNCGVFEHVTSRDTLNEIDTLVSDNGCLGIHTLIRENIPEDPSWMYLLPVHCSFHTNKSMSVLMDQWKYTCSIYNETAKLWILFKSQKNKIDLKVKEINNILGWEYLKFKVGFLDYWK